MPPRRARRTLSGPLRRTPQLSPSFGILASSALNEADAGAPTLQAAVGGFNAPTGSTTGTTVAVTGLGFQPEFVFCWMVGRTETSDAAALSSITARPSFGMFAGPSERYAWGLYDEDGNTTIQTAMIHRDDVAMIQTDTSAYKALDVDSMDADGFTLSIDSSGTGSWTAYRIQYLALGGGVFTLRDITSVTVNNATGNESYTPFASQPTALVFAGLDTASNSIAAALAALIGAATGSSNQWGWAGMNRDGSGTSEANNHLGRRTAG